MGTLRSKAALIGTVTGALVLAAGSPSQAASGPGLSGMAGSAPATSSAPVLGIQFTGLALLAGGTSGPEVGFTVTDPTVREVPDLAVTLDTSALPAGVTIDTSTAFGWSCSTSGSTVTCVSTLPQTVNWYAGGGPGSVVWPLALNVTAAADAGTGAGSLTLTATATGLNTVTTSVPYSVAEPIELLAPQSAPSVSGPGGTGYTEQWSVTNGGTTTVHGVTLTVDSDWGIHFVGQYANCRYDPHNNAFCTFDNDLVPGQTYTVTTPMGFRIARDHVAPFKGATFGTWSSSTDFAVNGQGRDAVPGRGPVLALVSTADGSPAPPVSQAGTPQTDQNFMNSTAVSVTVTGTLVADLAAVGARGQISGTGDSATLRLGVQDLGPAAAALNRSGEELTDATITVPSGTTATSVPLVCAPIVSGQPDWQQSGLPGFGVYDCALFTNLAVYQTYPLTFTVTATTARPSYTGSITIASDSDPADNTAPIVLVTPGQ